MLAHFPVPFLQILRVSMAFNVALTILKVVISLQTGKPQSVKSRCALFNPRAGRVVVCAGVVDGLHHGHLEWYYSDGVRKNRSVA